MCVGNVLLSLRFCVLSIKPELVTSQIFSPFPMWDIRGFQSLGGIPASKRQSGEWLQSQWEQSIKDNSLPDQIWWVWDLIDLVHQYFPTAVVDLIECEDLQQIVPTYEKTFSLELVLLQFLTWLSMGKYTSWSAIFDSLSKISQMHDMEKSWKKALHIIYWGWYKEL